MRHTIRNSPSIVRPAMASCGPDRVPITAPQTTSTVSRYLTFSLICTRLRSHDRRMVMLLRMHCAVGGDAAPDAAPIVTVPYDAAVPGATGPAAEPASGPVVETRSRAESALTENVCSIISLENTARPGMLTDGP